MRLLPRFRTGLRRLGLALALLGVLAPMLAVLAPAAVARPAEALPAWVMAALCGPVEDHANPAAPGKAGDAAPHHLVLCPLCPVLSLVGPLLVPVAPSLLPRVPAPPAARVYSVDLPVRDGPAPGARPRGPPAPV